MSKYRCCPSTDSISPAFSQGVAPATPHKTAQFPKALGFFNITTRFKLDNKAINDILSGVNRSSQKGTVEEEFEKYMSGLSPPEMDILHFWEVSIFFLLRMNTPSHSAAEQEQVSNSFQNFSRLPTHSGVSGPLQKGVLVC